MQKFHGDLKDLFALSRKTDAVFSVTGPLQTVLTLASFLLILLYGSQRLQLARAYLRDAPCLILDEATANLDPESEAKVSQAVDRIAREKVVIIAHRLSTIANADKIYFLDQGQVQAAGRHEELLKQLPKYRAYVEDQLRPLESR